MYRRGGEAGRLTHPTPQYRPKAHQALGIALPKKPKVTVNRQGEGLSRTFAVKYPQAGPGRGPADADPAFGSAQRRPAGRLHRPPPSIPPPNMREPSKVVKHISKIFIKSLQSFTINPVKPDSRWLNTQHNPQVQVESFNKPHKPPPGGHHRQLERPQPRQTRQDYGGSLRYIHERSLQPPGRAREGPHGPPPVGPASPPTCLAVARWGVRSTDRGPPEHPPVSMGRERLTSPPSPIGPLYPPPSRLAAPMP